MSLTSHSFPLNGFYDFISKISKGLFDRVSLKNLEIRRHTFNLDLFPELNSKKISGNTLPHPLSSENLPTFVKKI